MRRIILFILLLPVFTLAQRIKYDRVDGLGRNGELHGHAIKVNLPPLALTTLSVQAERFMPRKTSLLLGVRWTPNRRLPFFNLYKSHLQEDPDIFDPVNKLRYNTFSLKPEVRKYFGREAGKGFYLGLLGVYDQFNLKTPISFTKSNGTLVDVNFRGANRYGGLGMTVGAQFKIGRRWLIDWWISGSTVGYNSLYIGAKSPDFGISQAELDDFNSTFSTLDSLGGLNNVFRNIKITATNNELSIRQRSFAGFNRAGLCVGYRLW